MENNEEEVSLTDSTVMSESEMQSTRVLNKESSLTESIIMSKAGAESTPVTTKIKEKEWSMADMIKLMRTMSDDIEHNMNSRFDVNDIKFNEVRSDINELNIKSESNFHEIKQNNVKFEINMNKRLNEIDEHCSTCLLYTSRCV